MFLYLCLTLFAVKQREEHFVRVRGRCVIGSICRLNMSAAASVWIVMTNARTYHNKHFFCRSNAMKNGTNEHHQQQKQHQRTMHQLELSFSLQCQSSQNKDVNNAIPKKANDKSVNPVKCCVCEAWKIPKTLDNRVNSLAPSICCLWNALAKKDRSGLAHESEQNAIASAQPNEWWADRMLWAQLN